MSLPVLDLSLFHSQDELQRQKLAEDLTNSLRRHGFVKLINHGISEEAVAKLFDWNRRFFNMSPTDKAAIANTPGPNPQRGWSRVNDEKTSTLYRKGLLGHDVAGDLKDAREHFDQGAPTDTEHPNKWPSDNILPGFRADMETAFKSLECVAADIMRALEIALCVPEGTLLDHITPSKSASEFRLNHYPSIEVKEIDSGTTSRIWPHFDLGVITLLFQDDVGGLEFENREKRETFDRIECGSRADMVVNVSETLQRWTNNILLAGLHRVSKPDSRASISDGVLPDRYSIAYFCKADRDAPAGSLQQFIPQGTEPLYQQETAIEYHMRRLRSAY